MRRTGERIEFLALHRSTCQVEQHDAGWTAHTPRRAYAGLWPDKQAAAEALVRQAGYELLV